MTDRFVIVGGDAAGMSAAGKAKRDAPEMDVVVLERGGWVSYGACGLPYYVKGEIAELEDLVVMDPRKIVEERGIDLRRHHDAIAVDRRAQTVAVEGSDGLYEEPYDALLLATGGSPTIPAVPGTDLEGVFTIRSLEAGHALKNYIAPHDDPPGVEPPDLDPPSTPSDGTPAGPGGDVPGYFERAAPETVSVVGANKIGIELAEAFLARGMEVRVFEAGPRALPSFGADVAEMVEDHLREAGVELHFETGVDGFRGRDGRVTAIETTEGVVATEAVAIDVGVEPHTELAVDAGIECGPSGAIATDAYGRTNDPCVYAAGDCAEKRHLLTGDPIHWPYALSANRAGRAVGRTVAGQQTPVGEVVGTLVMKALDLQVARSGIVDHDEASDAGFDPVSATITTISRAHYYGGWSRIVVHATADADTGRLVGVNIVGREGVAHRINAVATALTAGMTVTDVGGLDFGYAPPFGPVWDPVIAVAKVLGEKLRASS